MESVNDLELKLNKMKSTFLDRDADSIHRLLGEQIDKVMNLK